MFFNHTVICEFFVVKKFSFHPKRQKFLTRILLLYIANIWHTREIDENIVTRKFLT